MYKFLSSMLLIGNIYAFDNQYNIGYGYRQATLDNGLTQAKIDQQTLNLNIEHLFDLGLWLDINANMVINSVSNQKKGLGSWNTPVDQSSTLGGINSKLGYSFNLIPNIHLIPYTSFGRNTNLAASTIYNSKSNIMDNYYYSTGIGLRAQYNISSILQLYLDQGFVYNFDQSKYQNIAPQDTFATTITLGSKINIGKYFQIGLIGFYTAYQNMANIPNDPVWGSRNIPIYTEKSAYGAMVSLGLTY